MREKHRDRDRRLPAGGPFAFRAHVALVGPMGAGKTTVGRLMSIRLGMQFMDTDERIESRSGMAVARIFERHGEKAFRTMERRVLEGLAGERPVVIAAGGGLPAIPGNADRLRSVARTLFLDGSARELARRLGNSDLYARPMLRGGAGLEARLEELMNLRRACYERAADARLFTDGLRPEEIAALAVEILQGVL